MNTTGSAIVTTLLMTDLVGSTGLVEALGDGRWAALSARCDACAREAFHAHGGREIDKSDGFLVLFERPIDAVRAAVAMHRALRALSAETGHALEARAAIHLGEAIVRENPPEAVARGAKAVEVEGLVKPMAARLMGLATARQTLMGAAAFELARRAAVGEDSTANVRWRAHGPYSMKGIEEFVDVFEAGEEGIAPLAPPPDSEKARSMAALDEGMVTGWRPSAGADVPSAPGWTCIARLGAGAFGEVWKVMRRSAAESREKTETKIGALDQNEPGTELAFKFCFDLVHARALQREATLFKLIQQRFGHHAGIVRLLDFQLEHAPLFLAMEHVPGRNVAEWLEEEGKKAPLGKRLAMFAGVAGTIAEIHAAGIILADIKPSNILVRYGEGGAREFVIADLGIGRLREKSLAEEAGVTKTTGFTKTNLTVMAPISGGESGGGTLLYLAPEVMEGAVPSVATDAYALGVTLFQVAAGNPRLAVAEHWKRHVPSGPARRLTGKLLRGDPKKRLANFTKVEKALKKMPARLRRAKVMRIAAIAAAVLLVLLHVWWFGVIGIRNNREVAQAYAEARAAGVPTTQEELNKKYPVTQRGESAVMEASQIFIQLDTPRDLSKAAWVVDLASGPEAPDSPDSLFMARMNRPLFNLKGARDIDRAAPLLEKNRPLLEKLVALRKSGPPADELYWGLDVFGEPPISYSSELKALGQIEADKIRTAKIRGIAEALMPLSILDHLQKGNPGAAYEQLLAWRYVNKAIKGQQAELLGASLSMALDSAMDDALVALMESHPPDAATCVALLSAWDAASLEKDYVRAVESENIADFAAMEKARGASHPVPRQWKWLGEEDIHILWGIELAFYSTKANWLTPLRQRFATVFHFAARPYKGVTASKLLALAVHFNTARAEAWSTNGSSQNTSLGAEIDAASEKYSYLSFFRAVTPGTISRVRERQSDSAAIHVLLRLRLRELESASEPFTPPATLAALDAIDHRGIPRDYTQPGQVPVHYEPLFDLGVVKVTGSEKPGSKLFWAPWGSRTLDATVLGASPMQTLHDVGAAVEVFSDPEKRRNHILRVRTDSGRELRVICADHIAQAIGFPDKFPAGTRVRIAKRPVIYRGELVFDIVMTKDIEALP